MFINFGKYILTQIKWILMIYLSPACSDGCDIKLYKTLNHNFKSAIIMTLNSIKQTTWYDFLIWNHFHSWLWIKYNKQNHKSYSASINKFFTSGNINMNEKQYFAVRYYCFTFKSITVISHLLFSFLLNRCIPFF